MTKGTIRELCTFSFCTCYFKKGHVKNILKGAIIKFYSITKNSQQVEQQVHLLPNNSVNIMVHLMSVRLCSLEDLHVVPSIHCLLSYIWFTYLNHKKKVSKRQRLFFLDVLKFIQTIIQNVLLHYTYMIHNMCLCVCPYWTNSCNSRRTQLPRCTADKSHTGWASAHLVSIDVDLHSPCPAYTCWPQTAHWVHSGILTQVSQLRQ